MVNVEMKDVGTDFSYRIIYSNQGKTYHASIRIDKENQDKVEDYWNEIIEIPIAMADTLYQPSVQFTVLRVNDLARNANFENVHTRLLSEYSSLLSGAQLLGAKQKTDMFTILYTFFFLINNDYYKVQAEFDSSSRKISIESSPENISLTSG